MGEATRLDSAQVLRAHGLRDQIHPQDAFAFTHPDPLYAGHSVIRDQGIHGNDVFGPWKTEMGMVWVVDIRPQLRKRHIPETPPTLADGHWNPRRDRDGVRWERQVT